MIAIVVYEGVSGYEALGALAAAQAAGTASELVSSEALVRTREGARLVPERLGLATLATAQAVLLPGGDPDALLKNADLTRALRDRRGKWTLASGEAIHALQRAGLVDGRRIAQPPGGEPVPGAASLSRSKLVADGRILTCPDADAVIDLVLHYLAHEHGADTARHAAETLGREWRSFALGATESGA